MKRDPEKHKHSNGCLLKECQKAALEFWQPFNSGNVNAKKLIFGYIFFLFNMFSFTLLFFHLLFLCLGSFLNRRPGGSFPPYSISIGIPEINVLKLLDGTVL